MSEWMLRDAIGVVLRLVSDHPGLRVADYREILTSQGKSWDKHTFATAFFVLVQKGKIEVLPLVNPKAERRYTLGAVHETAHWLRSLEP